MKKCVLIITLLFSFIFANDVYAATHGFELEAIRCPFDNYSNLSGYELYDACASDYVNGNLNDYILMDNDTIEPGEVIMFSQNYIYGGIEEVMAYSTSIKYDDEKWEPLFIDEDFYFYDNIENYPKDKRSKWSTQISNNKSSFVRTYGNNGFNNGYKLNKDIHLGIFFLKLRENVLADSKLDILFDFEDSEMLKIINNELLIVDFNTKNITLRVEGNNNYLNEIISNKYTIKRDDNQTPIVIGADIKTTVSDFINNFENNDGELHIFDKYGNEITACDIYVGSYMKIKLIDNNEVKDELTILVRGDFDGNGKLTFLDVLYLSNLLTGRYDENYLNLQIADFDSDGQVTAADNLTILNYFNKKINHLN